MIEHGDLKAVLRVKQQQLNWELVRNANSQISAGGRERGGQQSLQVILMPASMRSRDSEVGSLASGVRVTRFEYQDLPLVKSVTLGKLLNLSLLYSSV